MRRLLKLAVAAAFLGSVSVAGAEDIHVQSAVGTWKLNLEKSKTEAWTAKSQTRVYEDRGGGLLHARYEGTDAHGASRPWRGCFCARITRASAQTPSSSSRTPPGTGPSVSW